MGSLLAMKLAVYTCLSVIDIIKKTLTDLLDDNQEALSRWSTGTKLQEETSSLQFAKWAAMKPVKKKRLEFLEDGFQR